MEKEELKIKEATEQDIDGILDVQEIVWQILYVNEEEGIFEEDIVESWKPKGKEMIKIWQRVLITHRDAGGESNTWVVKDDNRVVGFCYAVKEPNSGLIRSLYLLPEYQNLGTGGILMKYMIAWLDKDKDIILEVSKNADKAIKFYERFGFQKTGNTSTQKLNSGKEIVEYEMRRISSK